MYKRQIYTITVIREAEPFAAAESPIYAAAQAYVDTAQNEATLEGLLAAVRAVEPIATLAPVSYTHLWYCWISALRFSIN